MTKEIPLSLQVFHSHNEYKAHRRNRTEELRLRDLEVGLRREEKLYTKEYALHKSKFHAHYARRFSDPVVRPASNKSSQSTVSRASVFSAPASLRHISVSSSLTSRLYESISEISTSSRFQRIQRKFSIASFTENGLLTAKGSALASNIAQARQTLFRGNWRASGKETDELELQTLAEDDTEEEVEEEGKHKEEVKDNHRSSPNWNLEVVAAHNSAEVHEGVQDTKQDNNNNNNNNDNNNDDDEDNNNNNSSNSRNNSDTLSTRRSALLKLRAERNLAPKKRVSIQVSENDDVIPEIPEEDEANINKNATDSSHAEEKSDSLDKNDSLFTDWKSIFSRPVAAARMDPLQMKIKNFLTQQSDFNKLFPKGPSGSVSLSGRHMELVKREKKRQEQEKLARKRKQEIVTEVLNALDIKDEHTLLHYNLQQSSGK